MLPRFLRARRDGPDSSCMWMKATSGVSSAWSSRGFDRDCKRTGTTSLYAALEIATGEVTSEHNPLQKRCTSIMPRSGRRLRYSCSLEYGYCTSPVAGVRAPGEGDARVARLVGPGPCGPTDRSRLSTDGCAVMRIEKAGTARERDDVRPNDLFAYALALDVAAVHLLAE